MSAPGEKFGTEHDVPELHDDYMANVESAYRSDTTDETAEPADEADLGGAVERAAEEAREGEDAIREDLQVEALKLLKENREKIYISHNWKPFIDGHKEYEYGNVTAANAAFVGELNDIIGKINDASDGDTKKLIKFDVRDVEKNREVVEDMQAFVKGRVANSFDGNTRFTQVDGFIGAYTLKAFAIANNEIDLAKQVKLVGNQAGNEEYQAALDSLDGVTAEKPLSAKAEVKTEGADAEEISAGVLNDDEGATSDEIVGATEAEKLVVDPEIAAQIAEQTTESNLEEWRMGLVEIANANFQKQNAELEDLKSGKVAPDGFFFNFNNQIAKARAGSRPRRAFEEVKAAYKAMKQFNKPLNVPGATDEKAALERAYQDSLTVLDEAIDAYQEEEITLVNQAADAYKAGILDFVTQHPMPESMDVTKAAAVNKNEITKAISLSYPGTKGYESYLAHLNYEGSTPIASVEDLGKVIRQDQETYDFIEDKYAGDMQAMLSDFNNIIYLRNIRLFYEGRDRMRQDAIATVRNGRVGLDARDLIKVERDAVETESEPKGNI